MSNRHPSTPPPIESESTIFFTTPSVRAGSKNGLASEPTPQSNSARRNSLTSSANYKNKSKNSSSILFTPQTPYVNNNDDEIPSHLLPLSPQTTTKKSHPVVDIFGKQNQHQQHHHQTHQHHANSFSHQRNFGINPLRTPETTPRHVGRRKDLGDIIDNEETSKLGHPIFQSAPSTVGIGRRLSDNMRKTFRLQPELQQDGSDRKGLLEFKSSMRIQVEQDEDDAEEDENEEMGYADIQGRSSIRNQIRTLNSTYEDDREKMLMNYTSSECDSDEENREQTRMLRRRLNIAEAGMSDEDLTTVKGPVTPPMQIMNEKYVLEKFGTERCKFSDSDDLEDIQKDLKNRMKYASPFLVSEGKIEKTQSQKKKSVFNPRLENEIEMVYHATGEKFYVGLSEEGKQIKPKRLNFDEFKGLDIMAGEELLQTPPMSSSHKMSIRGLLNYEDEPVRSDEEGGSVEEEEGIRHEKIENPFLRKFSAGQESRPRDVGAKPHGDTGSKGELHQIEYVNHTTGRHIIEDMDEEQFRIKPKRLDFSGC